MAVLVGKYKNKIKVQEFYFYLQSQYGGWKVWYIAENLIHMNPHKIKEKSSICIGPD